MDKVQFSELDCSKEILKAVADMGFEEMTPIQSMAIPVALTGKDLVGQAQTGTGKTAAFSIPMLEGIDPKDKSVQALVLCPTRELAVQIAEEVKRISRYKKGIQILPVFGGQDIERQIRGLKGGAQVVIGTPGRVLDHMRRRTLKTDALKMLILDEADEMLNMGFREDIELVLDQVDHDIQIMLFSATMPPEIMNIINRYQNDPEILKVAHKALTTPNIKQVYLEVREYDKVETLARLMDLYNYKLSIIFCNTKKRVDELVDMLQARGYLCDKIHGDMKQTLRLNVINKFKRGDIEILVATDVAARGLDIDNVEAVFNYDMPTHEEYYVHRIGRTGRAGKEGISYTFVTSRDYHLLRSIMRYTKSEIERHPIPKISDVEKIKQNAFLTQIKSIIDAGIDQKYIEMVESFAEETFSPTELAAALLQKELFVENAKEIDSIDNNRVVSTGRRNAKPEAPRDGRKKTRVARTGMSKLKLNVGKSNDVRPRDIVGAIANETGIDGRSIGNVEIFDNFTLVEIPEAQADRVTERMKNRVIKGKTVFVESAGKARIKSSGDGKKRKVSEGARDKKRRK